MRILGRVQIIAVVVVLLALLGAEISALALSTMPASEMLWWLNLQVFQGVNALYRHIDHQVGLDYRYSIPYLVALLGLSIFAHARRMRLGLALLSNVAFLMCGFTAYLWYRSQTMAGRASPGETVFTFDEAGLLMTFLIVASFLGLLASHVGYMIGLRRRRNRQTHS